MKSFYYIIWQLLLSVTLVLSENEYGNRPRGVPPEHVSFYDQNREFECLDGSKKIPFEQVNDDYCDCNDGSDEPGTSACSNGKFYCRNVGYAPLTVPASRVNDFICDCCDGSDEWDSGVQCPNVCQVQGRKAREEAQQQRVVQESGHAKRLELAKTGSQLLNEKRIELTKLKAELDELEPLKTNADAKKNEAEMREREAKDKHQKAWNILKEEYVSEKASELFHQMDLNRDNKVSFEDFTKFAGIVGEDSIDKIKEVFGDVQEFTSETFKDSYQKVKEFLKNQKAQESKEYLAKKASELYQKIDVDQDSKITIEEFINYAGIVGKDSTDKLAELFGDAIDITKETFENSYEQIRDFLERKKSEESIKERISRKASELFDKIDIKRNSKISIEDFKNYVGSVGEDSADKIKQIFGDATEFTKETFVNYYQRVKAFLKSLKADTTSIYITKKAEKLFNKIDSDKKSKISIEDFKNYVGIGDSEDYSDKIKEIFGDAKEFTRETFVNSYHRAKDFLKQLKESREATANELSKKASELFDKIDVNKKLRISIEDIKNYAGIASDASIDKIKEVFGDAQEFTKKSFKNAYQKVKEFLDEHIDFEGEEENEEEESSEKIENNDEDDTYPEPPYDEVTQNVIGQADDARRALEDVLRKMGELETSIRAVESVLNFEYGEDNSWIPLKGQCVELSTSQYIYKVCLFDRTIQKDRNGHSEISLGYWSDWAGPESNKFAAQKYDKGQSCWNGPERSTFVEIECGDELQLIEANEPSKCEYRFRMRAPNACSNPAEDREHSEL